MITDLAPPFPTQAWFEGLGKPQAKDPETEQTPPDPHLSLRCAACHAEITARSAQIAVSGQFEHHFFNPAGLVFLIGCFAAAPGCTVVGPASTEFSWFPPYAWRIACCAGCMTHLGWEYRQGSAWFFGLILTNLCEE